MTDRVIDSIANGDAVDVADQVAQELGQRALDALAQAKLDQARAMFQPEVDVEDAPEDQEYEDVEDADEADDDEEDLEAYGYPDDDDPDGEEESDEAEADTDGESDEDTEGTN